MPAKEKIREQTATGRRKTAVASVRLRDGNGEVRINGRSFEEYFTPLQRDFILAPLKLVDCNGKYNILVNVKGGGIEAQAGAVLLGIARALEKENENYRQPLKAERFLTRDPRKKERKKYGQPGARKNFQFSKR